jgi:hypothetical protein
MIVMATFSFPNKDGSESVILHALLSSAKILSSRGAWCETVLDDAFLTNDNRQGLSHLPQQGASTMTNSQHLLGTTASRPNAG